MLGRDQKEIVMAAKQSYRVAEQQDVNEDDERSSPVELDNEDVSDNEDGSDSEEISDNGQDLQ